MQNLNTLNTLALSTRSTPVKLPANLFGLISVGAVGTMVWLASSGHLFGLTVATAIGAAVGLQALVVATAMGAEG